MEPIFSMQYGEYAVAKLLKKNLSTKNKKISIFIPTSQQEKGIDMLAYRYDGKKHHVLTIQVKMSRTYDAHSYIDRGLPYGLWFNRFDIDDNADWCILVGIYCKNKKKLKANNTKWGEIMLAFTNKEMKKFTKSIKCKTDPKKPDKMFCFHFNDDSDILLTRGNAHPKNMKKYLIENRLKDIIKNI